MAVVVLLALAVIIVRHLSSAHKVTQTATEMVLFMVLKVTVHVVVTLDSREKIALKLILAITKEQMEIYVKMADLLNPQMEFAHAYAYQAFLVITAKQQ